MTSLGTAITEESLRQLASAGETVTAIRCDQRGTSAISGAPLPPAGLASTHALVHVDSTATDETLAGALHEALDSCVDGSPITVVAENGRHFSAVALRMAASPPALGEVVPGVPLASVRDLLVDAGVTEIRESGVSAAYLPESLDHIRGRDLCQDQSVDKARLYNLAHVVVFEGRRGSWPPSSYDSEQLAAWLDSGDVEGALGYIRPFTDVQRSRARLWSDLAVLLEAASLHDDAIACARRATSCDVFHDAARLNLFDLTGTTEATDEGGSFWESDAESMAQKAASLVRSLCPADALPLAELAVMRCPSTVTLGTLRMVLRELGEMSRAGEIPALARLLRLIGSDDDTEATVE
ncbi:MAG: hypothetical protein AMXMBFR64_34810 [Myxococcales bacterium]